MALILMDILLFLIGFYALVAKRNLIKKVIGFNIMEYAVNLLFILVGYRTNGDAPILNPENLTGTVFVDPLPQALVLTSIVIGLGVTAVMVGLCIKLYQHYGTFDIAEIRRLKG
jgi:multicomponent Na+:H+ antiporter subunit C